jgi:hypothetical protein
LTLLFLLGKISPSKPVLEWQPLTAEAQTADTLKNWALGFAPMSIELTGEFSS